MRTHARASSISFSAVSRSLGSAGQRWVEVTARRTRRDWAQQIQQIQQIQQLVEVRSPDAERSVLVMDTLTTPTPGALDDVFL
jgi:hypothetical protein